MNISKFSLVSRLVALASLLFLFTSAYANSYTWGAGSSHSPVRIEVIDDSGRTLNQYSTDSRGYKTHRTYLEAVKGKRYKLRIRNTSNKRIGVVVAVDGRNILNGKKSHLRNNEKMYVLDAYESANYTGWRTGSNRVNRFYFTSAGNSYSNAWGDRSAMGVIAVAVFDEKRKHYYNKHRKGFSNRSAPSQRGYLAEESTGTGFGREEYSPTIQVSFKAKNEPSFKHFFKYEWRKSLCNRGIISCNHYENDRKHNRFWPRETNNGYAPYPPRYNNRVDRKSWMNEFIVEGGRGDADNW